VKQLLFKTFLVGVLLATGSAVQAQIITTPFFNNFYSGNTTYNGNPVPVGSIIDAFDPDGVLCGRFIVHTAGSYGFMPVYGDDSNTPLEDEGAEAGDSITFMVNGRQAVVTGDPTWTNQANDEVDLNVASAIISLTAVDMPLDAAGRWEDTVRFQVGIRNDGDGLDFYGVTASADQSLWDVLIPDSNFYNGVGETTYVYFDVDMDWADVPDDTVGVISFEVFSKIDTTQRVIGSVNLILSVTDVDDDHQSTLPNGFTLYQNYPNPFNPTTTIAFALPSKSPVRLEIYNVLGQAVDHRELGTMSAGDHEVEYDASRLSSGVYFYRLVTGDASLSRKMLLLK
jgi:hypothetical protein